MDRKRGTKSRKKEPEKWKFRCCGWSGVRCWVLVGLSVSGKRRGRRSTSLGNFLRHLVGGVMIGQPSTVPLNASRVRFVPPTSAHK